MQELYYFCKPYYLAWGMSAVLLQFLTLFSKNLEHLYKVAKLFTKTDGISSWEYLWDVWELICLWEPQHLMEKLFSASWLELSSMYFGEEISLSLSLRISSETGLLFFFLQMWFFSCAGLIRIVITKNELKPVHCDSWHHKMCCDLGVRLKHLSLRKLKRPGSLESSFSRSRVK